MRKLHKLLLCLIAILTAWLFQGCNAHPVKSEENILSDIKGNDEYFALYNLKIADYAIISRLTSTERMTDDIELNVTASSEDFSYTAKYSLNYLLYDNGWILNAYEKTECDYSASKSMSQHTVKEGLLNLAPNTFDVLDCISFTNAIDNRQEFKFRGEVQNGYIRLYYDINVPCQFSPESGWAVKWRDTERSLSEVSWDSLCGEWEYQDGKNSVWFNIISVEALKSDNGKLSHDHLIVNLEYKIDCDKFGTWHRDSFHGTSDGITPVEFYYDKFDLNVYHPDPSKRMEHYFHLYESGENKLGECPLFIGNEGGLSFCGVPLTHNTTIFRESIDEEAKEIAITVTNGSNTTDYTVSEVSYFYHDTSAFQMTESGLYANYNPSESDKDQVYSTDETSGNVITYYDHFMEAAIDNMITTTALYDAAVKDGLTTADVEDEVNEKITTIKQEAQNYGYSYELYVTIRFGMYVTPSVFENCVARTCIASKYLSDHPDTVSYTENQLNAFYSGHANELDIFKYSYLCFEPVAVNETSNLTNKERQSQEAANLAAAKAQAECAQEALRNGDNMARVVNSFAPSSYKENIEDEGKNLPAIFSKWLSADARKAGDVTVIEDTSNSYFVVTFNSRYKDDAPTVNTRYIEILAEISNGSSTPTDKQMLAARIKAEKLFSQWKSGTATEESFAELAKANSNSQWGGLTENACKGEFIEVCDKWLFDSSRRSGDADIVEISISDDLRNAHGYIVIYYVGQGLPKWKATAKDNLLSQDTQSWAKDLEVGYNVIQRNGINYIG